MTDVEEIIEYIKSLQRGFDKDLFQSKINELAYAVDTFGLDYEDFHNLFKIWLNLSIPIKRWVSLGVCLVPKDLVEERTVDYAFRWLLANYGNNSNHSRMAYLLDWLTAAMDSGCIDIEALDSGYEIFYTMLSIEALAPHSVKLIYTLTKPDDVTRGRVLDLLDSAKKKEARKDLLHIHVLLGLFKSYKPECVPEDIPAISIHTSFKKINPILMERFRKCQECRNITNIEKQHLCWINPLSTEGGKHRKAEPLVPNMELTNIGSKHYTDNAIQKSLLDFSDAASLLHYSLTHPMSRPAKLRALLCNQMGVTLLSVAPESEHAFISADIYNTLCSYFLDISPHSYNEKRDLLHRLAILQNTVTQALPLITRFLAQYLPLWNEKDFFAEILALVEWIDVSSPEHVSYILETMTKMYHRAQPLEQCAILSSLTKMYTNLIFAASRQRNHFLPSRKTDVNIAAILPHIAARIMDMGNKELQTNPEDIRVLYWSLRSYEAMSRAECRHSMAVSALPRPLTLAVPLLTPAALLLDKVAALLLLYKKIFSMLKSHYKQRKDETFLEQKKYLEHYSIDFLNYLYHEQILTNQESGMLFNRINPKVVKDLINSIPDATSMLSLRNGLAFAPYTYVYLDTHTDLSGMSKSMFFDTVVRMTHNFPNLSELLLKAFRELR